VFRKHGNAKAKEKLPRNLETRQEKLGRKSTIRLVTNPKYCDIFPLFPSLPCRFARTATEDLRRPRDGPGNRKGQRGSPLSSHQFRNYRRSAQEPRSRRERSKRSNIDIEDTLCMSGSTLSPKVRYGKVVARHCRASSSAGPEGAIAVPACILRPMSFRFRTNSSSSPSPCLLPTAGPASRARGREDFH